jgi:hypothetical protein
LATPFHYNLPVYPGAQGEKMRGLIQFSLCLVLILSLVGGVLAQDNLPTDGEKASITVTGSASTERARFTAPSTVAEIRLEVYNSAGTKVFDNQVRGANVFDWNLKDEQAEPLADGSYVCVVTVKSLSGKTARKFCSLLVESNAASLHPVDAGQLTAQQALSVGTLEEGSSLTIVRDDGPATATVAAHDGVDGQIVRGQGALSFRLGDFYKGRDVEQMRLTPEGNLGIGITRPLVRLDVDGLVRASQGIVFPDGSIQYSAATKTLGAKSSQPDPSFLSLQTKSGKKGGQEHIDAAGTGTLNFIAKWSETGGSGTLQNSSIFDDGFMLSIGPGMNQPASGGALVFDLQRPSSSDILQRFWNTGTGGAKLRYVASVGATSQIQLTDLNEWLMSIAGNNSIGLQFRVRAPGDPNDEATLAARPRMTILRNGNVGIGDTAPTAKLSVNGDVRATNVATAVTGIITGNAQGVAGVYGQTAATSGSNLGGPAGVWGDSSTGVGVFGSSNSASGVFGSSGTSAGVFGSAFSSGGVAVWAQAAGTSTTALKIDGGAIQVLGAGIGTSTTVFVHRATSDNIEPGNTHRTTITHPMTDGDPNAILILTPNYNPSQTGNILDAHPVGVFYNSLLSKWQIFHEDLAAIVVNDAWNVLVVKP